MKQLLLELSIWIFTAGLSVNIWALQILIQKIRQFDKINAKLRDKFEKLESILRGEK